MQVLGISDSTPKPENRLKALFWPSIRHETDVDAITRQGFWICIIVAAVTLVVNLLQGNVTLILVESFEVLFFVLSAIGIRCRSVTAAACAFLVYLLTTFLVPFGVGRVFFGALLLANVRGTWLSSRWRSTQTEPPPVPLNETLTDKLADRFPLFVWPRLRVFYYVVASLEMLLLCLAIIGTRSRT